MAAVRAQWWAWGWQAGLSSTGSGQRRVHETHHLTMQVSCPLRAGLACTGLLLGTCSA